MLTDANISALCQGCGACCATDASWPRFSLEDDAALALIPENFINSDESGMRCDGNRCLALSGQIGEMTACTIHPVRPLVCRECMPGDPECALARNRHGLPALSFCIDLPF